MKVNSNLSTRVKTALRTTRTVVIEQWRAITRINYYLLLLSLICGLSAYAHIIYGDNDAEGIFGYRYMSSFVYGVGHRLALLSAGLIIMLSSRYMNEYARSFKHIGSMLVFVACFFLAQIFIDKEAVFNSRDLPSSFYYVCMVLVAVASSYAFRFFNDAMLATEEALKAKIRMLMSFIVKIYTKELKRDDPAFESTFKKTLNTLNE